MFKKQNNRHLPSHISYWLYKRDKSIDQMPPEDKSKIVEFLENHNLDLKRVNIYQQRIVFKRTTNFIYLVTHAYKRSIFVRTQNYLFYRTGELLYEFDHDKNLYPQPGNTSQSQNTATHKFNYEIHEKLNNPKLDAIGSVGVSPLKHDSACHDLLKSDTTPRSVEYIKGDI